MIKVTCAIIEKENRVLVVQRSAKMSLPLKWEFPGGKIENNDSEEDCIIREIKEELNLDIVVLKKLQSSFYKYPNLYIELIPFVAKQLNYDIKLIEHADYVYLLKEELFKIDWAEAGIPIVKLYLNL